MMKTTTVALLASTPVLLLALGCAGLSTDAVRLAPAVKLAPDDRPVVRRPLPAGCLVQLMPVSRSPSTSSPAGARRLPKSDTLDGWWRVAMLQTSRFDFAAGVESCPSPHRVVLHLDSAAATFTTTLEQDDEPAIGLAAVRSTDPGVTLDRLAWLTRAALGERLDMPPIPCQVAYSESESCLRFCEEGLRRENAGGRRAAIQLFERARSHDGGSPTALLHLATAIAHLGGDDSATRAGAIAKEALGLRHRLTPQIEHRLARVLVMAQRDDARLLELGTAYREDRPHDPHAAYTVALAQTLRGEFREARPTLARLRQRWPDFAGVRYQLCFAMLATGDPETALEVIEEAQRGLSRGTIVRPYSMALYHCGKHEELRRFLASLRRARGIAGGPAEHQIIRMQASHAILLGDTKDAVQKLADSMAWMRQHSSRLDERALEVSEDGEVLARLGATAVLADSIDGFYQLGQLPPVFASAMTYLGGLLRVQADESPERALQTLEKSNDSVWHSQLQAAMHHRRGELAAETAALERAVAATNNPLVNVSAARALEAAGNSEGARQIAATVQKNLLSFDQRKPFEHPLMTPGRAMAFVATRR